MKFELLDYVELLTNLSGEGLRCGQAGTVVDVCTRPNQAYEVEFSNGEGRTIAMPPLLPEQIALHSHARSS
jgi:hypothetical protein